MKTIGRLLLTLFLTSCGPIAPVASPSSEAASPSPTVVRQPGDTFVSPADGWTTRTTGWDSAAPCRSEAYPVGKKSGGRFVRRPMRFVEVANRDWKKRTARCGFLPKR